MKKYYFYIILCLITPLLVSCEDWFDVQPKSQVKADDLFNTQGGFKRALIGAYTLMAENTSYGASGTLEFIEILGGTYTSVEVSSNDFHQVSLYDYDYSLAKQTIHNLWAKNYTTIANLNNLLTNIDKKQDIFDEGIYEIIKGEALGLRAFIHFDLLRNFAPAPIHGLDVDAIPYVDAIGVSPFPQLTIRQVLERVTADLEAAEQLLRDFDPIGPSFESYHENRNGITSIEESVESSSFLLFRKERMNYYAVLGTLARVYLYRGTQDDITKAANYAQEVINSKKILLNDSKEIEKEPEPILYMAQEYLFSLYKRNLTEAVNNQFFQFSETNRKELSIDTARQNKYFETEIYGGSADVRLSKLFRVNQDGATKYLAKYNFGGRNIKRVPLLKLSEMYLILAEASEDPAPLLYLRNMRGLKTLNTVATLSNDIALEYRKELIGEGQLFYYYKRLNQLVNDNMKSPEMFVLPIPDTEQERGLIN